MKCRTVGRYKTKREVVVEFEKSDFKENGELKDEIADELGWNADETLHPWVSLRRGGDSFAGFIENITAYYGEFLRKRGLPDCCAMSCKLGRPDEPEEWRTQDIPKGRYLMPLNVYLSQYRGIEHDKPEDLAARIIWTAYVLKHFIGTNYDEEMKNAHELGRLETLFSIYSKQDETRQKPRAPKRKAWVEELTKELVRGRPESSNEALWMDISEELGDLDFLIYAEGRRWYVYRDDERLWASDADDERAAHEKGPTKRSFSDRYLTQARKPIHRY